MSKLIRIAGIVKESIVDGPGLRYTIFTQGCPHHCVGCHNAHTQDFAGGYNISIIELFNSINDTKLIAGVTFSGGEPFAQASACAELAKLIKQNKTELNIVAYSGYYYAQLLEMATKDPAINDFLRSIDILIDGPFDVSKLDLSLPFRGSNNQSIIDLSSPFIDY